MILSANIRFFTAFSCSLLLSSCLMPLDIEMKDGESDGEDVLVDQDSDAQAETGDPALEDGELDAPREDAPADTGAEDDNAGGDDVFVEPDTDDPAQDDPAPDATDAGADGFEDPEEDAAGEPDVEPDVEEEELPECGNGIIETGEECEPPLVMPCTTVCGTEGTSECIDCRFGPCEPPVELCNGLDDDCDTVVDDGFFPEIVDTRGGQHTSTIESGGTARVAYYEETGQGLQFGECTGGTCDSNTSWTLSRVDDTGPDVGQWASLAEDPGSGRIGISYYDADPADRKLKYAECAEDCTDPLSWEILVVDAGTIEALDDTGRYSSLIMNADVRAVAYFDVTYENLRFSWCERDYGIDDCQRPDDWSHRTVDSSGNVGMYSDMGFETEPDGDGSTWWYVIVYHDERHGRLNYAECWESYESERGGCADGTKRWDLKEIDKNTSGDVGEHVSMTVEWEGIEGGIRHVAYYDAENGDLLYARCHRSGEVSCKRDANWSIGVVASEGDVGQYASIDVYDTGTKRLPRISYYDATRGALILARCTAGCDDPAGGATWETEILDDCGDTGQYTSLVMSTGDLPLISYYQSTTGGLKFFDQR